MEINTGTVDEAALAPVRAGLQPENRAWKRCDWEAMQRLHAEGHISDPVGKAKSVEFTEAGLRASTRLLRARFCR